MPYIPGTAQPLSAIVRCPRCRVSRPMEALGGGLLFRCSGCEWPMTMGAGSSPLSTSGAVSGTPTGTSVPVTPCLNAHGSGKAVTVAVAAPTLSGQEANPQTTN